jgi:hypothetical protein
VSQKPPRKCRSQNIRGAFHAWGVSDSCG